jgi:isopentenyl diphosphate isomerase/L-lactate dehydrogenase-like FMN-dependent dehydrogenase
VRIIILCPSYLSLLIACYTRYVNRNREITKKYVQHAEKRGIKGLFITVDAPQLGRREKDMRMKFVDDGAGAKVQEGQSGVKKDQGVARAISVCYGGCLWLIRLTYISVLH